MIRPARIRLADRKIEEIASLTDLWRAADQGYGWTYVSVAPDGSPVFTRNIGTQEICAPHDQVTLSCDKALGGRPTTFPILLVVHGVAADFLARRIRIIC